MTDFGLAIQAAARPWQPTDYILGALDEWSRHARAVPDIVPIWWRLEDPSRDWDDQLRLHRGLVERGIQPAYYVTSNLGGHALDVKATAFASLILDGCLVRFNQEPDSAAFKAAWTDLDPAEYVDRFRTFANAIHVQAPDARVYWCMTHKRDNSDWKSYYPGDAFVDVVGFDSYENTDRTRLPADRWRKSIALLGAIAPGKPVVIGETGIARGVPRRARWVRALGDVDVEAIVYYDMAKWQLGDRPRRALGRLMR